MSGLDSHLEELAALITEPQHRAEAEAQVRALLHTIGKEELHVYEPELRGLIAGFLPKRRRALEAQLTQLLAENTEPLPVLAHEQQKSSDREVRLLRDRLRLNL